MSVSAPAHARFTAVSNADEAWLNTKSGSADWGPWNGLTLIESKPEFGQQEWGGLARDAGNSEHHTRRDSRRRSGQDDPQDRSPT